MESTEVAEIFDTIRPVLTELVREAPAVDGVVPRHSYAPELQRAFAERVLATVGFENGSWRLDPTVHPFCTSFSPRDVRLTTRYQPTGLDSFWSTMHEAGHGHYAHGIAPSLERTPPRERALARPERVTEPDLGEPRRPQPPVLVVLVRAAAGDLPGPARRASTSTSSWPRSTAPSRVFFASRPTRRRTACTSSSGSTSSAGCIEGTLDPKDLPEAWNEAMRDLLGVDVPDDARGVLQDVHWSSGGIGYFPTYALGNVISLQIWSVVQEAIPDIDAQMEAGELEGLSGWLRENLYSLGRKFTPKETIERLTGSPTIDPQPYLAYLRDKLSALSAGA